MPPKATADLKNDVIPIDPACKAKVKNTFLEFGADDEAGYWKRRTRSLDDPLDGRPKSKPSPLVVASKSPMTSPMLQPVAEGMQAVPIDDVKFELLEEAASEQQPMVASDRPVADGVAEHVAQSAGGLGRDEPAYVVPTTPSPFLHSSFPPSTAVPPFGAYGYNGSEMGLPPAFEQEGELGLDDGYAVQGMDMDRMMFQGLPFLPEMYDPSYGQFMGYTWGAMAMDGEGGAVAGGGILEYINNIQSRDISREERDPSTQALQGTLCQEVAEATTACQSTDGGQGTAAPADQAAGAEGAAELTTHKEAKRSKTRKEVRDEERAERRASATSLADRGTGGESSGPPEKAKPPRNEGNEDENRPTDYTTVMLRNIPNKYTREMLVKQLSVSFFGEFDFMYLPIDFKNRCNVGYSFINFRTQEACERFVSQFNGVDVRKCLPGLNSKKVVEVTPARVQGLAENVRRLRNSPIMNQLQDHPEWMPLIFNENGEEEPFPAPDTPFPPMKPRGRNREYHSNADAGE